VTTLAIEKSEEEKSRLFSYVVCVFSSFFTNQSTTKENRRPKKQTHFCMFVF